MYIYHDGSLVCCDRDFDRKNILVNVKDGVMKAWNGAKMQQLRQRHIDKNFTNISSCEKCNEWC